MYIILINVPLLLDIELKNMIHILHHNLCQGGQYHIGIHKHMEQQNERNAQG